MDTVKLEGGREMAATIEAIVTAGIPVMGHIGLTPQSVHKLGGFKTQGRTAHAATRLIEDAHFLEDAGCYAIVLESIPDRVAELISERTAVPTIGIGAGPGCDGQVLVTHDLLGLFDRFTPRFVKNYANLHPLMVEAFTSYLEDVDRRDFPSAEHSVEMPDDEWERLIEAIDGKDKGRGNKGKGIGEKG
jgi:3-methyl-2-oxobutanoate hydroxymethyltransferase